MVLVDRPILARKFFEYRGKICVGLRVKKLAPTRQYSFLSNNIIFVAE